MRPRSGRGHDHDHDQDAKRDKPGDRLAQRARRVRPVGGRARVPPRPGLPPADPSPAGPPPPPVPRQRRPARRRPGAGGHRARRPAPADPAPAAMVPTGTASAADRDAAVAEGLGGLPVPQQQQQRAEADQCADDVGQVGPEPLGGRVLAGDIGQGAHHRQRPDAPQAAPAGDEVDEDPRREQGDDRHDPAHRGGQGEQRYPGDGGQPDDRGAEGAVGDRRVVADGGHPDRVDLHHAQADQDGRDHRPGIAEPHQALPAARPAPRRAGWPGPARRRTPG